MAKTDPMSDKLKTVRDALEQCRALLQMNANSNEFYERRAIVRHDISSVLSDILLMEAEAAYRKLLDEEYEEAVRFAASHGWESTRYEAGIAARKRIEEARAKASQPSPWISVSERLPRMRQRVLLEEKGGRIVVAFLGTAEWTDEKCFWVDLYGNQTGNYPVSNPIRWMPLPPTPTPEQR